MKPNPLSSLNHFTVPVAMLALLGWRAAHSEDAVRQRHGALALHSPDPDGPAVPADQHPPPRANGSRPDKGALPLARERPFRSPAATARKLALRLAGQREPPQPL